MQAKRVENRAPRLITIENVTGLVSSNGGADLDAIFDALTRGG